MESFASFLPPHSFMACLCACSSVCCMHVYMCVSVHEYIFGRCVNCTYMYCMYLCLHMRYVCAYLCEHEIVRTYGMCEFLCVSLRAMYSCVHMGCSSPSWLQVQIVFLATSDNRPLSTHREGSGPGASLCFHCRSLSVTFSCPSDILLPQLLPSTPSIKWSLIPLID